MRKTDSQQFALGEIPIADIEIDLKSRDDIPPLLLGLQYIYITTDIRKKVFAILEEKVQPDTDKSTGRPGMELWKILVCGVLRHNLNWDYDRLLEMTNHHSTIRKMLGHTTFGDDYKYKLQTLRDNVSLLSPEILNEINEIIVKAGHKILKKKEEESIIGRCDSSVLKTDVHYPTDINLLYDSMRKILTLVKSLCMVCNIQAWRQNKYYIKKVKQLFRKAQQLKRSSSKDPKKIAKREELIIAAHRIYLDTSIDLIKNIQDSIANASSGEITAAILIFKIKHFINHAERQIDQIHRRVIENKIIPHDEKVFSIFEEHTEWISKGKAGVPVELGLRVCVLEDQYGFILHHNVMENETDDKIAVSMIIETQKKFPNLIGCSFDKGFYSPSNQIRLSEILENLTLPKKGKLSQTDKEREFSKYFINARHQHSAIESAINALQVHGLDRCRDHGINGFKRYVSYVILGRNIQQLGVKIRQIQIEHLEHQSKLLRKQNLAA